MEGYAPGSELGLSDDSGGDYLRFKYCADCGQMLTGNFPCDEIKTMQDYIDEEDE